VKNGNNVTYRGIDPSEVIHQEVSRCGSGCVYRIIPKELRKSVFTCNPVCTLTRITGPNLLLSVDLSEKAIFTTFPIAGKSRYPDNIHFAYFSS